MKNPASHIRKSLYELLNNQITYSSTLVPVYSSEGVLGVPYQINIMDYTSADSSDRSVFRHNATQVIEIVAEQSTGSRMAVDAIGELVMDKIQTTPRDVDNISDTDMEVFVDPPSVNYITESSATGSKIVRLILRYNLLITEKSY